MTQRRKLLLSLLLIPIVMIIISIGWPDPGLELVYLVIGVPIIVLNAWEFFQPEVMEFYFGKPRIWGIKLSIAKEEALMRNKYLIVLIILISAFIIPVVIYSSLRSSIDKVSFFFALFTLLSKLASKLWHFLTDPVIFISLLIFIMIWFFRKPIIMLIPDVKGIKDIKFPDNFSQSFISPVLDDFSPISKKRVGKVNVPDTNPVIAWFLEHGTDIKVAQLMLDIDGRDITKLEFLSKIDDLGLNSEIIPPETHEFLKDAFYRGTFESLYDYVLPFFCSIERKNKDTVACFTLRPGFRERLVEIVQEPVGEIQLDAVTSPPEDTESES
jgi:hypothetical protein